MGIHTSAITYRRGIPNGYNNFYFVVNYNVNNVIENRIAVTTRIYKVHFKSLIHFSYRKVH